MKLPRSLENAVRKVQYDILKKGTSVRWYLDLDAQANRLVLGMSNTRVDDHVLFLREPGAEYPAGKVEVGFYLMVHSENYGHGGRTSPEGEGMGEFTIYDWGNGAAAEAYNRILDKFGKIE